MIIDFTIDNIYQHQTYFGVGFALNWSGSTSAVVPVVLYQQQELYDWPRPHTDDIHFVDAGDTINFGG